MTSMIAVMQNRRYDEQYFFGSMISLMLHLSSLWCTLEVTNTCADSCVSFHLDNLWEL